MPANITAFIQVKEDKFLKKIDVRVRLLNDIFSASIVDQIVRMLIQGGSSLNDIFYQKIGKLNYKLRYDLTNIYHF
jgi:hypothetical protein